MREGSEVYVREIRRLPGKRKGRRKILRCRGLVTGRGRRRKGES